MTSPSENSALEPQLAQRMSLLPPYLFTEINRVKLERRRAGVDIIDMAMGNPTDPTPKKIVDKLCEVVQDSRNHRYSAAAGLYNLRREISLFYDKHYGVALDPEREVIATIGSKEGFAHLCLALIGPGDRALVPAPAYPIHAYGVILAGGEALRLDVQDNAEVLRQIDSICRNVVPKVVFLNYPHNPTGQVVELAFFEELVRLAKRYRFLVVHDFAYGGLGYQDYAPVSFLQARGASDVGVEFSTFSKTFNMAGWRIGFCSGNRHVISGLARVKGYYDYGVFQAIQIAAIVGLRDYQKCSHRQAARYHRRLKTLLQGLQAGGWNEFQIPRAGMFLWAGIPSEFQAMGSAEFCRRIMDEAEVALSPGVGFGPEGEGYVRIALIENRQRIQQATRQIRRCLQRWRDEIAVGR